MGGFSHRQSRHQDAYGPGPRRPHPGFLGDLTESKVHDSRVSKISRLPQGSIVVFDRGYNDYRWLGELSALGIYFVTRFKSIADIYKERRQIESFFKEVKQNPRIKRFVGTSENAVWIQIYWGH